MSFEVADAFLSADLVVVVPSLTTWSRLEPHPATPDLRPALAAPLGDPLWLLHRQWAFGEHQGEDAGSPIDVRISGEAAQLSRYLPGPVGTGPSTRAVDYSADELPLEVVVEREPALAGHPRLRAALGQQFLRQLEDEKAQTMAERFVAAFPLDVDAPLDPVADPASAAWSVVFRSRALDGAALAEAVRPGLTGGGAVTTLPPGVTVPQSRRERVLRALTRFIAFHDQLISDPAAEGGAWLPQRQEYAFTLTAEASAGRVALRADEYTDGRLDWWSFRASTLPDLGPPSEASPPQPVTVPGMFPSPVRYPGMPADRFWEFEDARVNLGALEAGPSDLGRLLLVEFGLVYGPDWWLVPLELPVGSVFAIGDLRVIDTFGVSTAVTPSRNADGTTWTMFELGQVGRGAARLADLFLLPPALSHRLEGEPLEEVVLMRDEMANLVWGIEQRVQGASGEPVERRLEASRLAVHQTLPEVSDDIRIIYRLMSEVPVNWIPFQPVATTSPTDPAYDLAFERRTLLRTELTGAGTFEAREVHPAGRLLRSDPGRSVETEPPLRIMEEEIPRDGAIVRRSFQYARWIGGTSFLWLGRAKHVGRGEGASNLRYDVAEARR